MEKARRHCPAKDAVPNGGKNHLWEQSDDAYPHGAKLPPERSLMKIALVLLLLLAAGGLLLPTERSPDPRKRKVRWVRGLILLGVAIFAFAVFR
jgi:hypothetical protein